MIIKIAFQTKFLPLTKIEYCMIRQDITTVVYLTSPVDTEYPLE